MLPVWFTDRFPARYVHARLFDWPDTTLADKTLLIPPGLPDGLRAAAPERVVLELLYEAGVRQSLEEVRNIFDSLRSPRKELLSCCTSVKTVRLFLTWARETGVVGGGEDVGVFRGVGAGDWGCVCRGSAGPTPVAHRQQQTLDEPACRRHPVEPEPPWIKATPIPFACCWPSHPKFSPTRSSQ